MGTSPTPGSGPRVSCSSVPSASMVGGSYVGHRSLLPAAGASLLSSVTVATSVPKDPISRSCAFPACAVAFDTHAQCTDESLRVVPQPTAAPVTPPTSSPGIRRLTWGRITDTPAGGPS